MAQSKVGKYYLNGVGTEQNFNEALKWFKRAADQNDSEAIVYLIELYMQGKGTERNYEEILRYSEKLSDKKPVSFYLGLIY